MTDSVRIARPEDYYSLWHLILQGHREIGKFALSSGKVQWWLGRMLRPDLLLEDDLGPRGAIGVIGPLARIEAMCFVVFSSPWYSDDRYLEEYLVVVAPEYRKSGHAKALIGWMKDQSQAMEIPLLSTVVETAKTESKVRLYERMLPKAGAWFLWNCKGIGDSLAVIASS